MVKNFDELIARAVEKGPKKVAVACAQDDDVLKALKGAYDLGIIKGILIGDVAQIEKIASDIGLDLSEFQLLHVMDMAEASLKAVSMVSSGEADLVMKGLVDTSIILKAVLNREVGLRTGNVLSHVAVFDVATYHKILTVTDAAMNIAPDLNAKKQIIENALAVTKALEIELPNVGVIAAKEKVTESMIATVHAGELVKMNAEGQIQGCKVGGPFALDNAVSKEAAEIKGIKDPMAGDVDILLCPSIEAGNVLYKALNFLANAQSAGIIVGAKAPIILTSRADSDASKLNSIALGVLMSEYK
ncbi:phosphate butyryltransferase [Fusibacter tunisiensis]|uniref:Phosphate butyryltransferase n=1 Tax=Fusibacter tunisiensis TaxID=1008308 RepID=A0ABS2MTU3_9FIRM|nr:phosphate butyryltransferase [Fusibacter tunisiensis]MBM7562814.1 phosphate butyryltransferase [Fusibacter tunisiensis]